MVADAVAKQLMWRCQPRKQITVLLPTHACFDCRTPRLKRPRHVGRAPPTARPPASSLKLLPAQTRASGSVLTSRFRADARSSATTGAQLEAELLARGLSLAVGRGRRLKRSMRQRCRLMRGAKRASMLLSGLHNDLIRARIACNSVEPF